jgi:hypothetical protein
VARRGSFLFLVKYVNHLRLEGLTAVTLKSTDFWNVKTSCLMDVRRLSCKTSVHLYETPIRYIPEGSTLRSIVFLRREQLKTSAMHLPENCKSPWSDKILAELIQAGCEILRSEIHKLNNPIWNEEEFGIINVGFDVTVQILIRFYSLTRYSRKNGRTLRQYINY